MLLRSTGLFAFRKRLERRNSFAFFSEWQERTYGQQAFSFDLAAHRLSKEADDTADKQVVDKHGLAIDEQSSKCQQSETMHTSATMSTPDRNATVDKKSGDPEDSTDYDESTVGSSSCMTPRSPVFSEGNDESIPGREADEKDNSHNDGYGCFVMIQNLPRNTTYDKLIHTLDITGFRGCYRIIYLPAVLGNRDRCMGYAFLGMSSREMSAKLIATWHKQVYISTTAGRGPVVAKLASRQGFKENITKWAHSKTGRINQDCFKPQFFPPC